MRVPIPSPSSAPTVPNSMVGDTSHANPGDSNESKLMNVMATEISSMRERLANMMIHYPPNPDMRSKPVEPVEPKREGRADTPTSPTATPTRAEEIKHRIQQLKEAMKFLVCCFIILLSSLLCRIKKKNLKDTFPNGYKINHIQRFPICPDIFPFPTPRLQSAAATTQTAGDFDETLPYEATGDWTAPTTEGNGLEPESNESDVANVENDEGEWQPPSDDVPKIGPGDNDEHPGKKDRIPVSGTNYVNIIHIFYYFYDSSVFNVTLELICGHLCRLPRFPLRLCNALRN